MGTSKTVGEFTGKIARLPGAMERAGKTAVSINAKLAVKNAEAGARSAAGPDSKLSGAGALVRASGSRRVVGRKGAKLGVSRKPVPGGNAEWVQATGPWPLVESNTPKHEIGPSGQAKETLFGPALTKKGNATKLRSSSGKSTAKGRDGRAKALRTPFGLRRRVMHPGTKGKKPWAKAAKRTAAEAPKGLQRATQEELRKVIR